MSIINIRIVKLGFLVGIILIYSLLIFKDIYSERTLVPNLEPFPDSLHYLNSAKSLINGKGWYLEREGRASQVNVPPLYPLVLAPVFIFTDNPINFYFMNIFLAFTSLGIIYLILRKLTDNNLVVLTALFFYITNYFIYWMPTLPMAENLSLPVFLFGVYLLLNKITNGNLILAGVFSILLYVTKYANLPLTISLVGIYIIKIFFTWIQNNKSLITEYKEFVKRTTIFFLATIGTYGGFILFESLYKESNLMTPIKVLFSYLSASGTTEIIQQTASDPYFSLRYMDKNLPLYLNTLRGEPLRFLWDFTPLVPKLVGILGTVGLFMGLMNIKTRYVSLFLILSTFVSIIFMSTFYSADARYIYQVIPTLIIGFVLILDRLSSFLQKKRLVVILVLIIFVITGNYIYDNFYRLKYQISLNLRHSETPWNYVSAKRMNNFLLNPKIEVGKTILASPMPPYYLDFFIDPKVKLLPLSPDQEFRSNKKNAWGEDDYSDFVKLYKNYIHKGYTIYVANYGLGNEVHLHNGFNKIKENFELEVVDRGCFNACNIFKVIEK